MKKIYFNVAVFNLLIFLLPLPQLAKAAQSNANTSEKSDSIQNTKNKNPFPVKYISDIDQKLTIKTITLAPVYDNVNGVYSEPIQKLLVELLQTDKVWGFAEYPPSTNKIFVETFDSKPDQVLQVLNQAKSQGLMVALITKGPHGLSAKLKLFSQDQGLLLLEEEFNDLTTFEVERVRSEITKLYARLKNKLPYAGFVLSRKGLNVTLNVGSINGVKAGQEISLSQILKLNRHPKLKTMIGVEKEILGKVKVTQVEPYLSFGQIIFEKESGVIDVGGKVIPLDFLSYPTPQIDESGQFTGDIKSTTNTEPNVKK